mmetsp:Transcript_63565/g.201009  ORF Transcript_63565/g.201009 Transcript_63565/m.201009 type:complete len:270 (-) Transcript_63565:1314-2123(-)
MSPMSIQQKQRMRPMGVLGITSPYPTVVTVTPAHQMASSMPVMYSSGKEPLLRCSKNHTRWPEITMRHRSRHMALIEAGEVTAMKNASVTVLVRRLDFTSSTSESSQMGRAATCPHGWRESSTSALVSTTKPTESEEFATNWHVVLASTVGLIPFGGYAPQSNLYLKPEVPNSVVIAALRFMAAGMRPLVRKVSSGPKMFAPRTAVSTKGRARSGMLMNVMRSFSNTESTTSTLPGYCTARVILIPLEIENSPTSTKSPLNMPLLALSS